MVLLSVNVYAQEAPKKIEAEKFSATNSATVKVGKTVTAVSKFTKGAWIKFDKVDFSQGIAKIKINVASGSKDGKAQLEFRLGDENGKLLGKKAIKTQGWDKFYELEIDLEKTKGLQDLVIVSTQGGVVLDWFILQE